jgi:thiol-disulfide isomerase/thioredoxin
MDFSNRKAAFNRRAFLRAAMALSFIPARGGAASAQSSGPPPFFTERSQFILLDPKVKVSSVALHRMGGGERLIAAYAGKALLINFWASWCAACRRELPKLERLQARAASEPFRVAPVSVDSDPARAMAFLRRLGLTRLETFFDPQGRLASPPGSPGASPFTLYGLPMSYIVDAHGDLVGYVVGEADWTSEAATDLLRYYGRS